MSLMYNNFIKETHAYQNNSLLSKLISQQHFSIYFYVMSEYLRCQFSPWISLSYLIFIFLIFIKATNYISMINTSTLKITSPSLMRKLKKPLYGTLPNLYKSTHFTLHKKCICRHCSGTLHYRWYHTLGSDAVKFIVG